MAALPRIVAVQLAFEAADVALRIPLSAPACHRARGALPGRRCRTSSGSSLRCPPPPPPKKNDAPSALLGNWIEVAPRPLSPTRQKHRYSVGVPPPCAEGWRAHLHPRAEPSRRDGDRAQAWPALPYRSLGHASSPWQRTSVADGRLARRSAFEPGAAGPAGRRPREAEVRPGKLYSPAFPFVRRRSGRSALRPARRPAHRHFRTKRALPCRRSCWRRADGRARRRAPFYRSPGSSPPHRERAEACAGSSACLRFRLACCRACIQGA